MEFANPSLTEIQKKYLAVAGTTIIASNLSVIRPIIQAGISGLSKYVF